MCKQEIFSLTVNLPVYEYFFFMYANLCIETIIVFLGCLIIKETFKLLWKFIYLYFMNLMNSI